MAEGVALSVREFPSSLLEHPGIVRRLYGRGGDEEVRFWLRDRWPCLAVLHAGQFRLTRWGNRHARRSSLPRAGVVWKDDLGHAPWSDLETHRVVILANAGYDGGVWYRIRQGIEGLLVYDEKDKPITYMLVEPSSHYFRTMTRCEGMPVMIGEVI
jgi:hypothetical protein